MAKKHDWNNSIYQYRALIFGIMMLVFTICQLTTILTFKSSLIPITGTLRAADIYVTKSNRGNSKKSELIFYLNDRQQRFYFVKNIGDNYRDELHEKILKGLNRADTVTVWVKKHAVNSFQPEVFQIDSEQATLLDFEKVRTDKVPMTAFTLFLGLGLITAFLWVRFPDKFNSILGA